MKEKIVLVGAGSAMFTRGLIADLIKQGWETQLGLVDTNEEALTVAERLAGKMAAAGKAPITVTASTDRRTVLPGATAVICTIGVGGRRAWEQDVFVPRKYGIFQPVGDSVMPGGTSRALRMIPAMVDIARDVVDLAPKALFFNYGNPMGPVCRAIRKETGAKVTGLCHGVTGVAGYLAQALKVPARELRYTAVGMNHLTWFTEVRHNGRDMMPALKLVAQKKVNQVNFENLGVAFEEGGNLKSGQEVDHPFSWELLLLFGAFPAVVDRHITEFLPHLFPHGNYYGRTLGVDAYSLEKTIAAGDRIYEEMKEKALDDKPLGPEFFGHITGEQEQVIEIIDSIRTDSGRIYSANLPNTGQVPNLPLGAIIEAPALADAGGLRHLAQNPLPAGMAGTLATRFQWVETVVEAALEGSRDKFVQALVLDGAVDSLDTAFRLADELLAVHKPYLPQFNREETHVRERAIA